VKEEKETEIEFKDEKIGENIPDIFD